MSSNRPGNNYQKVEEPVSSGPSWIAIIIMMAVFWPVGIYLLYKRLKADRKAALSSGKKLNSIGIALIVIGALALIGGVDSSDSMAGSVFFILCGIVLSRMGTKNKKEAIRIRQYIALIINQHITSLDELARATGNTYEQVCEDLNKIIERGYLQGAYINLSIRQIILPGQRPPVYKQSGPAQQGRTHVVQCKNCGAEIVVVQGTVRKCEYCGTPIQG